MRPHRIAYVLDVPELGGGVKVVAQHAELLAERGHQVTLFGRGERPGWAPFHGPYLDYACQPTPTRGSFDLVIATFWRTVGEAPRLTDGPLAHFCQGYEGDLEHLAAHRSEIEATYRHRLPTLTVTPGLAAMLATRFGRRSMVVPPCRDRLFRPRRRLGPRRRPWICVPGIFEYQVKGVPTALAACHLLRRSGIDCRVLRISSWPQGEAERALLDAERYLRAVPPRAVAAALRRCDLLLLPSLPAEGFGLPLLEAMASGVPAVASRIPATEHVAAGPAAELVSPGDPEDMATAAAGLLGSCDRWRAARHAGARRAAAFEPGRIADQLERAIAWAASRASGS